MNDISNYRLMYSYANQRELSKIATNMKLNYNMDNTTDELMSLATTEA